MTAVETPQATQITADHLYVSLGDGPGWVFGALATEQFLTDTGKVEAGHWEEKAWRWPAQADELVAWFHDADQTKDADCYFTPSLSGNPLRAEAKRDQLPTENLHADLDGIAHPERLQMLVDAGAWTVRSGSDDSVHLYVPLVEPLGPGPAADLLVRLADWLKADPAPARLNAYLRPAGTRNHKSRVRGDGPPVLVELDRRPQPGRAWHADDLDDLLPTVAAKPKESAAAVERERLPDFLPGWLRDLLQEPVTEGMDRSERTMAAAGACVRAGLTDGQILTALGHHAPTIQKYGPVDGDRFAAEVARAARKARVKQAELDGARAEGATESPENRPTPEHADQNSEPAPPALLFEDIATVAARVDAAPPPKFLARPVLVEDVYGVIGAEDKAGKSWAALDLAVTVAGGGKWLDKFECETPGRVLMFLGEGSDRKTIRRLRAVCEFHDVTLEELDIRVCHRAPNLTRSDHLETIDSELAAHPARLVILDPLYLSLGSTKSGILSEMGHVLGGIQHSCQRAGAAFIIVHHWNQTGTGNDRKRFTGAGAAEWGRVLVSIAVDGKRSTDGVDSVVDQTWRLIGDEIADTKFSITRRVWVDDVDNLKSPMHYAVMPPEPGLHIAVDDFDRDAELRELILEQLADGGELSGNALITAIREAGHTIRDRDVRRVAQDLSDGGPVRMRLGARNAQMFRLKEGS